MRYDLQQRMSIKFLRELNSAITLQLKTCKNEQYINHLIRLKQIIKKLLKYKIIPTLSCVAKLEDIIKNYWLDELIYEVRCFEKLIQKHETANNK